jgi:hypothetical protein
LATQLPGLGFELVEPTLGGGELATEVDLLADLAVLGAIEPNLGLGIQATRQSQGQN